jgi:hypothetical protein
LLGSLQFYLKGIIDGLAVPALGKEITARITPPIWDKADAPRAYIWGGRLAAARQTAPRGPGFTAYPWTADIYLAYLAGATQAFEDEPFPGVVDAVLKALQAAPMPTFITAGGVPVGPNQVNPTDTQIQAIGERFELDYPSEHAVLAGRQVWYSARIGASILEVVQA